MAQIDDFFMYENRVEGITDADYQRAQPYVEAAQAFAQTTYQSIYIIDYYRKNFLYVSDNPLFLCGHTADEVRQMGYGFYLSHVPEDEVPMLTELNRSGFRAFYDEPVENRRQEAHRWKSRETITLKPEEKQILTLSAQGYTMKEIAEKMLRSFDTVKFYRRQIFEKLDVQNITEALSLATSYGLV